MVTHHSPPSSIPFPSLFHQEKIIHHQVSSLPLTRGLYVGYLKLRSSLGNIRIQVPERHPSMLPHIKVRDNYNVSQEEWDWLHSLDKCEVSRVKIAKYQNVVARKKRIRSAECLIVNN